MPGACYPALRCLPGRTITRRISAACARRVVALLRTHHVPIEANEGVVDSLQKYFTG
jgi:hypothetical protein